MVKPMCDAEADVVVIGAGPAGSMAAMKTASKGYNIFLVEKDASPGESSVCAGGLAGISAKALNLAENVVEKNITKWVCHFPWQTYILNSPAISFQRTAFNRSLAENAEKSGAKLLTSTLAGNISRSTDKIIIHLKNRTTGKNCKINAKLAIFADGPNTLASRLFEDLGFKATPDNTAHAAIYELGWEHNPLDCFEFFYDAKVAPWGYGWIFPKKNLLNVGVACQMSKMQHNIRTYLDFLVEKHPIASARLRGRAKLRFAADITPLQHANKICGDRVLVVGDAAGMVDPIWGAGIEYALRAGTLAASAAVRALEENEFEKTLRNEFEEKWKSGQGYKQIKRWQRFLRLLLVYSKLDKEAYARLVTLLMIKGRARKSSKSPYICQRP